MAEHINDEDVAFFRVEDKPVAIALLVDAARDFARDRHVLGFVGRVVIVIFDHDRRSGERDEFRVRMAQAILKAAQRPLIGRNVAKHFEFARLGRSVDGNRQFVEHFAVLNGRWIGLAARQAAAVESDRRRLAGFDDGRKDGVEPRPRADIQPIEVIGPPRGISKLIESQEIIAVGRRREIEQSIFVGQGPAEARWRPCAS